jgi:hypothetical protein
MLPMTKARGHAQPQRMLATNTENDDDLTSSAAVVVVPRLSSSTKRNRWKMT